MHHKRLISFFAQKVLNQGLKRHRSAFVGLARAVWHGSDALGLPKQTAFDEAFRAAQDAWRTSAAEAIARMTARLGTADTPLGRDVSRMQKLADEIVGLNEEDMRELTRWSAVQRADPNYTRASDELRAASAQAFQRRDAEHQAPARVDKGDDRSREALPARPEKGWLRW